MSQTLLRWAGSKKKLIPELSKYFDSNYNKYIEPFVGSAQLFFNIPISSAVLSDLNIDLINTYNCVKNYPAEVYSLLSQMPKSKQFYYWLRDDQEAQTDEIARAARFLYLNTYCFNGLYRTNLKGKFNVPYSESSGTLISHENLLNISNKLKKAYIVQGDFEEIVKTHCLKNDFVYLDPPYAIKNKRIFNQYNSTTFGLNDLERLRALMDDINSKNAYFVLSYASCDEASFLATNWSVRKVNTVRNISGFAKHRKIEEEIIISNIY